ncbi:MAG TPA: hypothetical protein VFP34_18615 [Microlunatus sp.]|nr:hypothetical protein [Microlunatus sp.]
MGLLAPSPFVLAAILMVSLAIAGIAKPTFGQTLIVAGVLPPMSLAVLPSDEEVD